MPEQLSARILSLGQYAQGQSLGTLPIHLFDRDGAQFFSMLVQSQTPFITCEKNANHYKLLEQDKTYTAPDCLICQASST